MVFWTSDYFVSTALLQRYSEHWSEFSGELANFLHFISKQSKQLLQDIIRIFRINNITATYPSVDVALRITYVILQRMYWWQNVISTEAHKERVTLWYETELNDRFLSVAHGKWHSPKFAIRWCHRRSCKGRKPEKCMLLSYKLIYMYL